MGDNTTIEWTRGPNGEPGATWNPLAAFDPLSNKRGWHCQKVSPGCKNCYAAAMNDWRGNKQPYTPAGREKLIIRPVGLDQPYRWKRPRIIFVCSMTDLFAEFHTDGQIDAVFAGMLIAPQHTYKILTKRADRMADYLTGLTQLTTLNGIGPVVRLARLGFHAATITRNTPEAGKWSHERVQQEGLAYAKRTDPDNGGWPAKNIHFGVSVENQQYADERLPHLKRAPGNVKFISYEPALGPVDWTGAEFVNQILCGGESGTQARPMHPDWARETRDWCQRNGVAFHFKQWGEYLPVNQTEKHEGRSIAAHIEKPRPMYFYKPGKHIAGRMLDGREWNEHAEESKCH